MAFSVRIHGVRDIQDATIKNASVASDAKILESKIDLDYSTKNLYSFGLRTDESRVIENNVNITFPSTGYLVVDSVNGKTYRITFQNGVQVATEV